MMQDGNNVYGGEKKGKEKGEEKIWRIRERMRLFRETNPVRQPVGEKNEITCYALDLKLNKLNNTNRGKNTPLSQPLET